jgi:hypothetical protein
MPFKNYVTEKDLKSYIPELSRLLWAEEADFSGQKAEAENLLVRDLLDRGYSPAAVMPELELWADETEITTDETGETFTDEINTMNRFVLEVTKITGGGTKEIILEGSSGGINWVSLHTAEATQTGITTAIVNPVYKYYRVRAAVSGGTMGFKARLADTTLERFIIFKWLELILLDRFVTEDDQFYLKMKYFRGEYDRLWNTVKIPFDENGDGVTGKDEIRGVSTIKILK